MVFKLMIYDAVVAIILFFFLQMNHYLERTLHTVELQKEKLFDLQLVESLVKVFPDVSF